MDRDAILKLAARHAHVVSSTGNAAGCVPNYLTFRPDGILSFVQALAAATAAMPERKPLNDDQRRRIILDCNTLGEAIAATERAHNIGPAAGATGAAS